MKKIILLVSLFTFIVSSAYAGDIKFTNYNKREGVCVTADFYVAPIKEFCRYITPDGRAVVKNSSLKSAYNDLITLLTDRHNFYRHFPQELPEESVELTFNSDSEIHEKIAVGENIEDLDGTIKYKISPNKVTINMLFNGYITGVIELTKKGSDIVIEKDTEFMDFLIANGNGDFQYPLTFSEEYQGLYGGDKNAIWQDFIYKSSITFPSGKSYDDVLVVAYKYAKRAFLEGVSLDEAYNQIFSGYEDLPNLAIGEDRKTKDKYGSTYEFMWEDTHSFVLKTISAETEFVTYYYFIENTDGVTCVALKFDYPL